MKKASFRRIIDLDRRIRNGLFTSAQEAAWELGVSRRTIERDLEELRYALGAELEYNRGKRCYQYKGQPVTLPAQWLNERELAIILIAERALRNYTGTSFHAEIHPAFNKLLDPVRHDKKLMDNLRTLCRSVYFYRKSDRSRNLTTQFSIVLEAIMQQRMLSFMYYTPAKRNHKRVEVEPYALINTGRQWVVAGYNRRERIEKPYLLSNIHGPRIEERYFAVPRNFNAYKYMK
jgi:predicted DNA-binding transcriptional regulator YafY